MSTDQHALALESDHDSCDFRRTFLGTFVALAATPVETTRLPSSRPSQHSLHAWVDRVRSIATLGKPSTLEIKWAIRKDTRRYRGKRSIMAHRGTQLPRLTHRVAGNLITGPQISNRKMPIRFSGVKALGTHRREPQGIDEPQSI